VYGGDGNYQGLFRFNSVNDAIAPLVEEVPRWVASAQALLSEPLPDIEPGEQCTSPYECPFLNHCAPNRDEGFPLRILPRITKKLAADLQEQGITDVRDIREDQLTSPSHIRVWRATLTGKPFIDKSICEVLKSHAYPRYYLDFETIGFAVPRWKDTRPFQQTPFQWSCHIEPEFGVIEHKEFLETSGDDPTWPFLKSLLGALGDAGPIFVYSSFEKTILKSLITKFPGLEARIEEIIERLVDLYPITVQHYYHPDMRGSWSIKSVLPTISADLDYTEVGEVQDGGMAQQAYLELISLDLPMARRASLEHDLLEYCKLDTLAMVKLEQFLENAPAIQLDC
jgi:hypothetical protein